MKLFRLIVISLLVIISGLLINHEVNASPGDTITVQTFTFSTPGSPKEGWFQFPSDSLDYEKILMYYTLKCDNSQNPACGEWDYLTYTKLHEYTGDYDSTLLHHPKFEIIGNNKDTIELEHQTYYHYKPWWMKFFYAVDTLSLHQDTIGQGTHSNTMAMSVPSPDHRVQYLWRASEFNNAGFSSAPFTGLWVKLKAGTAGFNKLMVSAKQTTDSILNPADPHLEGFQELIYVNTFISGNGWHYIRLTNPINWDGQSNIICDLKYVSGAGSDILLAGDSTDFVSGIASVNEDYYLEFDPGDKLDAGDVNELDSTQQFTFETWARIDDMKTWTKLFVKAESIDKRIGMEYGPSSNNKASLYLLAGNGSNAYGYTGEIFEKNKWYHFTMVYDGTQTGNANRLKLYVDGQQVGLNYNSTIPAFTASTLEPLIIGDGSKFDGAINDVRFWDQALLASEVQSRYYSTLNNSDPLWNNLLIYYPLDNDQVINIADASDNNYTAFRAFPQFRSFKSNRVFDFQVDPYRPQVIWEQAQYAGVKDSILMMDSTLAKKEMIVFYNDSMNPTTPTDTIYSYISDWKYVYDSLGNVVDSVWYSGDSTIIYEDWIYYGSPYEIINKWEIGRFITPYGIGLDLGADGWTWVYDVTDYEPLLHDSVYLSSGNWQELLDLKFVFIEGTPAREVVDIQQIHEGSYQLKSIDTTILPQTVTVMPQAQMWRLKTRVTGHRFNNPTNCAEFCPKMHYVKVNGITRWNWQIVQECADNPLYPQGGTWLYDRAGWCPGAKGKTRNFELTPFISGNSFTVDYDSDPDSYGEYVIQNQLISYGLANFDRDAGITQIKAPSDWKVLNRLNPTCSNPVIEIVNRGTDTLKQLSFNYGFPGDSVYSYTWNGNLTFMNKEIITLPSIDFNSPAAQKNRFFAAVFDPNGLQDQYVYNDTAYSTFDLVPEYNVPLVVYFQTNNNPQENEWKVYDHQGNVVYSRKSFNPQTQYMDTLNLPAGCYELILKDSDHDGISWWANNETNGFMRLREQGGTYVAMLEGDFGKQIRYPFRYGVDVSVEDQENKKNVLGVFPNPADGKFKVMLDEIDTRNIKIEVFNNAGKEVYRKVFENSGDKYTAKIDLSGNENGMYFIKVSIDRAVYTEKIILKHTSSIKNNLK
ncbi:MAG: T9SS type A sorting domain-containing protein [Bacteroidales bacterium]|nr:T9SS type A sorting domain-containing protein [Bacteroidales bacterium]